MEYKLLYKAIASDVMLLRFFPLDRSIDFKPGQFVQIKKDNIFRPYSIASIPEMPYLEFIIDVVGRFTTMLKNAEIGEVFDINGPYGKFIFENDKKAVFIAGGSGIAPIMSMVRSIVKNHLKGEYYVFVSNRNVQKHPFLSELEVYKHAGFIEHITTFTREEVKGYRNGRFEPEEVFKGKEFTYYICGNMSLVRNFTKFLKENEVDNIKFEGWG